MGWKKKEKELSLEEALVQARSEQVRFWLQSPPLVTAFPTPDGGHAAFPLEPVFRETRWLVLHVDPFSIEGSHGLRRFVELIGRYERHDLKPWIVSRSRYECIQDPEALAALLREARSPVIAVIDSSGSLQQAYGVQSTPALQIVHEGSVFRDAVVPGTADSAHGLPAWIAGFEASVQRFVRIRDPGLPLPPVLDFPARDFSRTRSSWPLRLGAGAAPVNGIDSFLPQASGWSSARFPAFGDRPFVPGGGIELAGTWSIDAQRLVTRDPEAGLRFRASGSTLRMVLAPLFRVEPNKRLPHIYLTLTVNGLAVFDEQAGMDLRTAEDGGTEILVDALRFQELLRDFDRAPVEIRLGFRGVEESPVVLYGIELGERV